jgi:uncharacterized DUF497 family protein
MRSVQIIWDDGELADGNVQHIAEHGLTMGDVEHVLETPIRQGTSHSTRRPCCWGYTPDGDFVIVVYEEIDENTIYPITAYEVPEL